MTIRFAKVDDLNDLADLNATIQDLHHDARPDLFGPTQVDELRQFLSERLADSIVVVAETPSGTIAGYALAERQTRPASAFRPALSFVYIHHIAVESSSRRIGIGEDLVRWVVDLAKSERANAVRLDSWSFNVGAHEFFEAQGFSPMNIIFERSIG